MGVAITVAGAITAGFLYRFVVGPRQLSSEQRTNSSTHQLTELNIKADSGDLTRVAGPEGMVVVTRTARWVGVEPVVTQQWNGDTLTVTTSCPETANCQVDLEVRIPAGAAVHADVASGDVAVSNLAGALDLTSESGTFDLHRTSGSIRIAGGSGGITGSGLTSKHVDMSMGTGTINVIFQAPPTSATAVTLDSGDVELSVPRLANGGYRVVARTGSGERKVGVAQRSNAAYAVTASTADGDVTLGYS